MTSNESSLPGWTQLDFDRIMASTFVEDIEYHAEIGSTNDRALELLDQPDSAFPLLIVADRQTAGRGRGGNRWWSDRGALTVSLVLATGPLQLGPARWPSASLTTGLAVCEALEDLLDEPDIKLKWPNDVYVRQRKACGVLIEAPAGSQGRLVVGIGVNVNNSLDQAPPELRAKAIALCDAASRQLSLADVLQRILIRLEQRFSWIGSRDRELHQRWSDRCLLTGRSITLVQGERQIAGACQGIDPDGALLVHTPHGPERCFAGEVTHF